MTIADLIVRHLCDAGVRSLFGMPGGGSNLDVIDAAARAGLPFVLTATETCAAIAALAQSEITGAVGACVTTLGPGVASVVNGVACAHLDRAPILVITDRYPASVGAAEHQRLDHGALLAPVTKWSAAVTAESADEVMREAIVRATSGQPGPVHLDVPADVIGCGAALSGRRLAPASGGPERPTRHLPDVFRRPVLLAGLGARRPDDVAAIRAFCAAHRVPALVTCKAKGVVPDNDPLFAGVFTNGAIERPILERADLLIGVGLDPVELLPRPWTHAQPIVAVARWPMDDKHVPFTAQFVGDVSAGLSHVAQHVAPSSWDVDDLASLAKRQRSQLIASGDHMTPDLVVRAVAAAAAGVRVTVDAGAHMFPATMLWPVSEPHGMLISNGLSTMGFALPAAIGAALVDRGRPVVALTGDGGLLMCVGELLTAVRERLRIVTVVFSDALLSLIAVKQQRRQLAPAGVSLGDVAWGALAESFGVAAHFATTEAELVRAVAAALAADGPTLIEARVDPAAYAEMLRAVRG